MYFFLIAGISWFIAQTMKVILESIVEKRFVIERYSGDGGYPSCHSAFVSGFLSSLLFKYDWHNWLSTDTEAKVLGTAIVLFLIVIKDSTGIRREVGDIAKTVNLISKYLNGLEEVFLRFLPNLKQQGHLPHEMNAGLVIGVITAISMLLIIDYGNPILAIISGIMGLSIVIVIGIQINMRKKSD